MLGGEGKERNENCEQSGKTLRKRKKKEKKTIFPSPLGLLSPSRAATNHCVAPLESHQNSLPDAKKLQGKKRKEPLAPFFSLSSSPLSSFSGRSFRFPFPLCSSPPPLLLPSVQKRLHKRRGHREARDRREHGPRARSGPGLKRESSMGLGFAKRKKVRKKFGGSTTRVENEKNQNSRKGRS